VAWLGPDGVGGYENEGQSLRLFDVEKKTYTKVMSEYVMVDAVQAVKTASGKTAVLVSMSDGGLGGKHFAILDPERGQVFRQPLSDVLAVKNGKLTLGLYEASDFESDKPPKAKKTRVLDLDQVLAGKPIVNKRSP
ncbi:MAG: hypothetical protein ACK4N5_06895, partial [Myxococcales bacterium]